MVPGGGRRVVRLTQRAGVGGAAAEERSNETETDADFVLLSWTRDLCPKDLTESRSLREGEEVMFWCLAPYSDTLNFKSNNVSIGF
ncbi:hypothetical protein EYF80_030132 [Liparis tanakae]|uniref:Uncharacterized protein n=1 Tax=Liparis tanakae TaxID=230148 RepID=A0A4Z2H1K2_9TELE|nr:hypothetical protein EYF80_030132 [Liparis tanakae]